MNVQNYNQYGGVQVEKIEVYGDLHLGDDKKLQEDLQNTGSGSINTVQTTPPEGMKTDNRAPVTAEMAKTAATAALNLEDESGCPVFTKILHWHSIFRILNDCDYFTKATDFTEWVQKEFSEDKLPEGLKKIYLKDASNIHKADSDGYNKKFDLWSKTMRNGKVDPRYLIAEKCFEVLDGLRMAAALAQSNT